MRKIIIPIFVSLYASHAIASPPDTLETWRAYAVYENGFDAKVLIDKGTLGNGTKFDLCTKQADHSSWKGALWSEDAVRTAEYIFFYGCFMSSDKKLSKEEFISLFGG